MTLPRLLLANEAGGGRGHVLRLVRYARAFAGHLAVTAVTPAGRLAGEFTGTGAEALPGPRLDYAPSAPRNLPVATFGDWFADLGMARPETVRAHIDWWRRAIIRSDASVLVADFAPLALMAARGLRAEGWDIAIFTAGMGYGLVPWPLPGFPVLHPDQGPRPRQDEAALTDGLNAVAGAFGVPPLAAYPEAWRADLAHLDTFPMLDPHAAWRGPEARYLPMFDRPPATDRPGGGGDEVFCYFSSGELGNPALIEALETLPLPRRAFLPFADPAIAARLAASGMILEPAALSHAAIRARSRLLVHAGQHGSLMMGMLNGLPQVSLPNDLERLAHATRAATAGASAVVPLRHATAATIRDTIRTVWASDKARARTAELAADLRRTLPPDASAALRDLLRPGCAAAGVTM